MGMHYLSEKGFVHRVSLATKHKIHVLYFLLIQADAFRIHICIHSSQLQIPITQPGLY